MDVYVEVKPPLARRCRCGLCFDAVGRSIKADEKAVAALRSDPWLVVTEVDVMEDEDKKGDAKEAVKKAAKPINPPNRRMRRQSNHA